MYHRLVYAPDASNEPCRGKLALTNDARYSLEIAPTVSGLACGELDMESLPKVLSWPKSTGKTEQNQNRILVDRIPARLKYLPSWTKSSTWPSYLLDAMTHIPVVLPPANPR